MQLKIKKFLYNYSKNCRLRTKELGKFIGTSQQSASYLIKTYDDKKIAKGYMTIIDPAKFGFINILVYYYFSGYTYKVIQEVVSFLKQKDEIVHIQELSQGYDLSCTFCVTNLSQFNKLNGDFLQEFKGKVFMADIFPIIVKHIYPKNYLLPNRKISEIVICGDRDKVKIADKDKKILHYLFKNPRSSVLEMSRKLNLNPKTIINIKNKLEKSKIIRRYSVIWDYEKLDLERKQILISTEGMDIKDDEKFLEFVMVHPYIVGLTRLIGTFDFLIEVEGENLSKRSVLKEIRLEFPFKQCKVFMEGNILKDRCIPESILR
jgi:DNA-binding Lrp family transcriptional regulator